LRYTLTNGDGTSQSSFETGLFAARFTATGTADSSFSGDGIAIVGDVTFNNTQGIFGSDLVIAADPSFAIVRETPAANGYLSDLDALSDGRIMAIRSDPNQLIAIDSDGVPATNVTIPYDRIGTWQPPTDWQPFPHLPVSYRETTADVTGDGVEDRIYVSKAGDRSAIRVVNGQTGQDLVGDFQPYEDQFHGGMFVDAGDFDGDGKAEIVVSPDEGGSARIQVFTVDATGLRQRANFFAIDDPNFRGGGSIGVLDLNEGGTPDLVVGAAKGGSQRIASFDGKGIFDARPRFAKLFGDYFAPFAGVDPMTYRGGVQLATGDYDGNGREELKFRPSSTPANATVLSAAPAGFLFHLEIDDETLTFDPWNGTFVGGPAA
jgi:hypothetical protein